MSAPAEVDIVSWNSSPSLRPAKIAAILAVLTGLLYVNSLSAPFIFDDWLFAAPDGIIRLTWNLDSPQHLNRAFGTWTLKTNFELGGNRPWGYRAFNIAVHALAGLVLFGLVRRTLRLPGIAARLAQRADWIAAAVALLWLAHPLQTQAVTYIVQRYESLMGLFFLLTLYCVLRGSQSVKPRDWYIGAFVACLLGAASKEVMVVCPIVLLLFDRAFLAGTFGKALKSRGGLYASLLVPVAYIFWAEWHTLAGSDNTSAGFAMQAITPWEYLRSQPGVLLHYLRMCFWPDRLVLDYGWPIATSPWQIYGLGAVILLMLGASFWATWRHPRLGVLGMAFFLILAPTSSIVPIRDLAFEHRMYLPLAVVAVLFVLAAEWLLSRLPLTESSVGSWGIILIVAAAAPLGLRTIIRNRDYRDPVAVWRQCIERNPANPRPYRILGTLYESQGRELAEECYEKALALAPGDYRLWIDFGNFYLWNGRLDKAAEKYAGAAQANPRDEVSLLNLGRVNMMRGDYAAAVDATKRAFAIRPDAMSGKQVAWLLATADDAKVRDGAAALRLLRQLPQNPRKADIQYLEVLAAAQAETGDFDQAIATAERTLAEARQIKSRRVAEFEARLKLYRSHQPFRMKVEANPRATGAQTAQR